MCEIANIIAKHQAWEDAWVKEGFWPRKEWPHPDLEGDVYSDNPEIAIRTTFVKWLKEVKEKIGSDTTPCGVALADPDILPLEGMKFYTEAGVYQLVIPSRYGPQFAWQIDLVTS